MRVDKNSSLKSRTRLCPKTTSKGSHRTCQGHVITTDLPTLVKSPKPIQSGSTTQEAKDLSYLRGAGWTLLNVRADCPREGRRPSAGRGGPSEIVTRTSSSAPKKWIVHDGPADHPPHHGPSGTLEQTVCKLRALKINQQNGSNERRSITRTNMQNKSGC
jgi:hypothetical protein